MEGSTRNVKHLFHKLFYDLDKSKVRNKLSFTLANYLLNPEQSEGTVSFHLNTNIRQPRSNIQ